MAIYYNTGVTLDYNEAAVLANLVKNYVNKNTNDLTPEQIVIWKQLINKLEAI